jgi:hypothetical protein
MADAVIALAKAFDEHKKANNSRLEKIMATVEEIKTQAKKNADTLNKVFGEIRAKLDELLSQQGDVDAKIAAAVAAARAEDKAGLESALEEVKSAQDEQTSVLDSLDAIVPDAPEEPTEPEPPIEPTGR